MIYDLQNYAQNMIVNSIKNFKYDNLRQRYQYIDKLLDYYQGDNTSQYITDKFKASAFKEVPITSYNVTKRMIDRMSRIYTLGATRTLESNNEEYESLIKFKDFKIKHIEKMTRLLGTIAVQVSWKKNADGTPYFDYTPFYKFDVITNPDNPLEALAIIYPMLLPIDDASQAPKEMYCYWDDKVKRIYDEKMNTISETPHKYGRLPFVFLHRDHQIDSFFCYPAHDIISVNEMVNILFTEMNLGMRFQMFGQYVATGLYSDENIQRAGSDEIIVMPDGTDLSILSPSVNISEALKLARAMLELVAQNNHLQISFSETNRDRPSSGIALKIKDLERFENYQDDLELFAHYERELYDLERSIALANRFTLPFNFGVDFNEPEYPMNIPDEISWNAWLLENNLTTRAKLLQKYNKDLTDIQANAELIANGEVNGREQQPERQGSIFERLRAGTQRPE